MTTSLRPVIDPRRRRFILPARILDPLADALTALGYLCRAAEAFSNEPRWLGAGDRCDRAAQVLRGRDTWPPARP